MSTTKRVSGDYRIISVNKASGGNVLINTHTLEVDGNLIVRGESTNINVEQVTVEDPIITLGKNNSGTFNELGIEVVKGPGPNPGDPSEKAGLRWNTSLDRWEISKDNAVWEPITSGTGFSLFNDPNPTLSNTLDLNDQIVTSPNDIRLIAGSGSVEIGQNLKVIHRLDDPATENNFTLIYAKEMGNAGTGLYVSCDDSNGNPIQDELVSRSKAIIFSIIF